MSLHIRHNTEGGDTMKVSLDHNVLFWLTTDAEQNLMAQLHEYLDNMYLPTDRRHERARDCGLFLFCSAINGICCR
ncbi:MAG: hypothetical protein R3F38_10405 [Gammaproteobacteria bacterium]